MNLSWPIYISSGQTEGNYYLSSFLAVLSKTMNISIRTVNFLADNHIRKANHLSVLKRASYTPYWLQRTNSMEQTPCSEAKSLS